MPTIHLPRRAVLRAGACAAATALGLVTAPAGAAEFPARPIRIIVPFPPGQGADASARTLARELEAVLGQTVIVDNRPGGNNVIGVKAVLTSPADGHTLFYGTNSPMSANAAFFKDLGYDPVKDFTPVARLGRAPWVLVVSAASPITSFEVLVRTSKQPPENVSFAAGATGYQLAAILLAGASGMKLNIVPYKGSPQAITDVIGQQATVTMSDFGTMQPLIKSGRVRPLLAVDTQRIAAIGQVPSLTDLKLDIPVLYSWTALFAPAGTPPAIVNLLADATLKATQRPAYKEFIDKQGGSADFAGAEELAKFQKKEIEAYRHAMKVGRVEPQ